MRVVQQHRVDVTHALIGIEEDNEEHDRHAQCNLGPDAEAEPQQEDRRQHHARQRIRDANVGIK
jgi:hypothetical protein